MTEIQESMRAINRIGMVSKMTEEETVGGKPIEEYRERVEEGNNWWARYCHAKNEELKEGEKVAVGCIICEKGDLTMAEYLSEPRRYVGEEDEEPKV